jgi:hypothetical protein
VAHYRQARTLLRRLAEIGRLWNALEQEVKKHKLNERVVSALADAALGLNVKNPTYRKQADITNQVAKKDLKRLWDIGLLIPKGERRGRHYVASPQIQSIYKQSLLPRERFDPFKELAKQEKTVQPELPGIGLADPAED